MVDKYLFSKIVIIIFPLIVIKLRDLWRKYIKVLIKEYKEAPIRQKDYYVILFAIFIFPFLLWILDSSNSFSSIFPYYKNITREYDWLSFIGSYSSAIVSAFLLIIITEQDRKANSKILRNSQRPYLDISYMKISRKFFEKKEDDVIILNHGMDDPYFKSEYLTLCIKNNGASVAIINPNKTKIILEYDNGNELIKYETNINLAVNRLTIKSGEEVDIRFLKKELYKNGILLENSKIIYSIVFYNDLFGTRYVDECKLEDNLKVLRDNEIVSDIFNF